MKKAFAEVALDVPVDGTFSYSIPEELSGAIEPGMRVTVPFGRRTLTGFVTELAGAPAPGVERVRAIKEVLDTEPLFDAARLGFYRWISSYYLAPIGAVLSMAMPAGGTVRSRRRITLTGAGREAAANVAGGDGPDDAVLRSIGTGGAYADSLARRMRGTAVHASIERLKKQGLVTEEVLLTGGAAEKTRLYARATGLAGAESAGEEDRLLARAPLQRRALEVLRERGEVAIASMEDELPGAAAAVKGLVEKGLAEVRGLGVRRDPFEGFAPRALAHEPNAEQGAAIECIKASIAGGAYSPFLLYGITGSGKTLVYLKAIEATIAAGRRALMLTPEIALTPWPAAYLAGRFPGRVALAHSGLSEGERFDEWRRIAAGEVDVVVGARSALFAPIQDLGLIIVDEEHETSYKQEEGVRYNARNASLVLGRMLGATVVLGSATPSVETFHNASNGKLTALHLTKRVEERPLPTVELVDMRTSKRGAVLSEQLTGELAETIKAGHQGILFINRRGFSSFLICADCGQSFSCTNCSVTLTMHKARGALRCHYCDFSMPVPTDCPSCGGVNLTTPGMGTEKVEEEIVKAFPGVRTARMDRDTTRARGSAQSIVESVENREVDLLIGTQMVSKGHDFPGVTLVGVISGDTALGIPDFRSAERTFQLITQAAGRAGRGEAPGRVVIQTLNPGHYCFTNAVTHDYGGFYETEVAFRAETDYPPFSRLCCLRLDGTGERTVERASARLADMASETCRRLGEKGQTVTILGPVPAMLARLKGRYRWNLLVKCPDVGTLHSFVRALKAAYESSGPRGVNLSVDMDPITIA